MTDMEVVLGGLPRPAVDPAFAQELLAQILAGAAHTDPALTVDGDWRRRLSGFGYVGGAIAGAAALALGAAFGWRRHRTSREGDKAA